LIIVKGVSFTRPNNLLRSKISPKGWISHTYIIITSNVSEILVFVSHRICYSFAKPHSICFSPISRRKCVGMEKYMLSVQLKGKHTIRSKKKKKFKTKAIKYYNIWTSTNVKFFTNIILYVICFLNEKMINIFFSFHWKHCSSKIPYSKIAFNVYIWPYSIQTHLQGDYFNSRYLITLYQKVFPV